MRKIFYLIVLIVSFVFCCNETQAVYKAPFDDESNLLAKCVYKDKSNNKLILDITNAYKIHLEYMDAYRDPVDHLTITLYLNVEYTDMVNEQKLLTCKDEIYLLSELTGSGRSGKQTYRIQSNNKKYTGGVSEVITEYILDKEETKIFKENVDKEEISDSIWMKICHYGGHYLKFNKEKYESDITPYKSPIGVDPESLDVMAYLSENNYSCPTSLCSVDKGWGGHSVIYYYFEKEYNASCYVSQDYVGEYRCGALEGYIKEYEKSKELTATESVILANKAKENIKTFCNSAFKNLSYEDPTECVKECLEIQDIFNSDIKFNSGECVFSHKLIVFIRNILRWIKYIIPAAVIILGILDFIKAIGADKDDEMKKAQGKFIKRLIAAALIFLIPLIIEFVLGKMGFGYNDCGLF